MKKIDNISLQQSEIIATEHIDNGYLKLHCPEFTEKQLSALDAVYRGPVNPKTNEQIYNGMPIGSEIYSWSACRI
ncbi:MAG: hypothetical protein UH081_06030 [Clostridia bacterium]|nr:hypothetical protein [Clostridia bacterium]